MNRCVLHVIPSDDRGSTLAIVLLTIMLLATLALSLSTQTLLTRRVQTHDLDFDRAAYVARAGFERACAEVLLTTDDWSTLSIEVYPSTAFAGGDFEVTLVMPTTDAATVQVLARMGETARALQFAVDRQSDAGGPTTGVRVAHVTDLSLDQLD